MAKRHHHLDAGERHQQYALLKQGYSLRKIAAHLGRAQSTIKRELDRNLRPRGGYEPNYEETVAYKRRSAASSMGRYMAPILWETGIWPLLRQGWSPEQIAGQHRAWETGISLSAKWFYVLIARDRAAGGTLYRYLRHKGKQRRKYTHAGCSKIPDRTGIGERPPIVDAKVRVGDWEADFIFGQKHKGYLLMLVERTTKYVWMGKLPDRRAETVKRAMVRLLRPYRNIVHTIAADNGMEFAQHAYVAQRPDATVYSADAYASWQRGLSEHTNGPVREYFPKRSRFTQVSHSAVRKVTDRLNHRPRKVLQFETPAEAFAAALHAV